MLNKGSLGRLRRNAFLIVFIVAGRTTGHTQTAAPAVDPNTFLFEVVSIHPDAPGEMSGMTRVMFERSRYEAEHVTVKELIREAYGVEDLQIQQAPKWLDTDTFSVDASMDRATADTLSGLGEDQSRAARQHMLQALLADRFRLILGRETKELSVFSLAFAKGDAGLKKADPANTYSNGVEMNGSAIGPHIVYYQFMAGAIQMKGQGASMDQLVDRLNQKLSWQLGRIFVNNSGLKGDYDFELNFSVPWSTSFGPMMSNSQPADGTTGAIPESSLFSAVQEQLGLKLKSTKGPIQVLSIEHIEEPSEN